MTSNPYFNPIPTPLKPSSTGFSFSSPKLLFPNSPRIFPISRPAIHDGTSLSYAGSYGNYWSSVPYSDNYYDYAWYLGFNSGRHDTSSYYRFHGQSVRPVQGFTK